MKLFTVNQKKVCMTPTTLRSLCQRSKSVSDGHRSLVNSLALEQPKEFEPKPTRIL